MIAVLALLATFAFDANVCPAISTTVSGANASTTAIVVTSGAGFAINQSVQLTAFTPPTFHIVTNVVANVVTISPAAPSAPTTGNLNTVCLHQHLSATGVFTGGTATVNFPTAYTCGGAGTVIYYVSNVATHGSGTTTGAPSITAGTPANFSTIPTLVVGANSQTSAQSTVNGGTSVYRAVCAGTGTDTSKVTSICTGGTNTCSTGAATGTFEAHVQMYAFTPTGSFATPGNVAVGNSVAGTPSLSVTTTSGDKLFMSWSDFTGANCTQTFLAGSSPSDIWEVPGALNVGCNVGNDDYYVDQQTTTTTSAGTTSIGVSSPTNALGAWVAMEVCDPTASACPNSGGAVTASTGRRGARGAGR